MRTISHLLVSAITLVIATISPDVLAQDRQKIWKVGILWHAANLQEEMVMFGPFAEGMKELKYTEDRNVIYDHTYVDEDYSLFQTRAQELVDRKVDIILASVASAAAAASRVTKTLPIVFATSGDPVKMGLVQSLRQPGGMLTGLSLFYPEQTTKHLELIRELVPHLSKVAILWNVANEDHPPTLQEAERAARLLQIQIVPVGTKGPQEFDNAFVSIKEAKVDGLIVLGDAMLRINRQRIVDFASSARLPAVYGPRDYAESGGLLAYGACVPCNFRRSAAFIDRILKGAKPGDLPVEQPTRLHLTINHKTAKALGLPIPQSILLRTDELIE